MERFYTSDLHFGHNMLVDKAHRPFASTDEMNTALIDMWNDTVRPADEVWILGDLAMLPMDESLAAVAKLNGRKVLVPGNHDFCWQGQTDQFKFESRWFKHVIRWQMTYRHVGDIAEIVDDPAPHRINGEYVQISHFPYTADHTDPIRYPEHRPTDVGGWLLHGHIHEMWQQHDKQINVGVDAWGLRPVHVDEIANLIAAGPADRPAVRCAA